MKCDICGYDSEKVVKCRICGVRFCEDCGQIKKKLCMDCEGYEEVGVDMIEV